MVIVANSEVPENRQLDLQFAHCLSSCHVLDGISSLTLQRTTGYQQRSYIDDSVSYTRRLRTRFSFFPMTASCSCPCQPMGTGDADGAFTPQRFLLSCHCERFMCRPKPYRGLVTPATIAPLHCKIFLSLSQVGYITHCHSMMHRRGSHV